jgi:peptidoglycan/LPS O-acetylase OafA/YrhL
MKPGERVPELDALRGIAIVGVLVLHSSFESRFSPGTMALQATMARLFDWAVLAFFFSSGLLHDRFVPFAVILKKRSVSLLATFVLYNVFYNICFAAIDALGWVHKGHLDLSPAFLVAGLFQSPAFQLYFLPYLFVIAIGVSALEKLSPHHPGWVYAVLLVMVLAFYIDRGYPEISFGPAWSKLPLYLAAFLTGVAGRPFFKVPLASPWMALAALSVMLGVLGFCRIRAVSLFVPPLVAGVAGAVRTIRQSKPLLWMGKMSGSIYLWHTPVMLPAITRLLAHCGIPSLFNFFGSIALTLSACIVLRVGLDRLFTRITKKGPPKFITL